MAAYSISFPCAAIFQENAMKTSAEICLNELGPDYYQDKLNKLVLPVVSLVVRASDSRPESLGSMPDATKYPPEYVLVKSVGLKSCDLSHEFRDWIIFPSPSVQCSICGGGDRWCRHLLPLRGISPS
ncbi:hypothetical protein TNCV_2260571 [Trichonephila clavipes]|nr:hypothetical protein TNCV_2260571 [Trichonephila clavipes]